MLSIAGLPNPLPRGIHAFSAHITTHRREGYRRQNHQHIVHRCRQGHDKVLCLRTSESSCGATDQLTGERARSV